MRYIIPIIILCGLLILLFDELFYAKTNALPSSLIGHKTPSFQIPRLDSTKMLTQKDLTGRLSLLNVWATWCDACTLEHNFLMKINSKYHIPIYAILYKDNPDNAREYLAQVGNPYVAVGIDESGDTAIDFGIYGTPETFVIDAQGNIIYRYIGAIDQTGWDKELYPVIQKWLKENDHAKAQ